MTAGILTRPCDMYVHGVDVGSRNTDDTISVDESLVLVE